jgi:hypothetical protein
MAKRSADRSEMPGSFPRTSGGSESPRWVPGKASHSSRWRRVIALTNQAMEALKTGKTETARDCLQAIRAIAQQALEPPGS